MWCLVAQGHVGAGPKFSCSEKGSRSMTSPYRMTPAPPGAASHAVLFAGVRATSLLAFVYLVTYALVGSPAIAVLCLFPIWGVPGPYWLPFFGVLTVVRPVRMAIRSVRAKMKGQPVSEPSWSIACGSVVVCLIEVGVLWVYGMKWSLPAQVGAWLREAM